MGRAPSECQMKQCPECQARVQVLQIRNEPGHNYRRYECLNGHRFTTREYLWDATTKEGILRRLNLAPNSVKPTMRMVGHGCR